MQLRRLVITEAGRCQDLGRLFLPAQSRAHHRRVGHRLPAPPSPRSPADRPLADGSQALQQAGHGGTELPDRASPSH
jgi:hypothetical protein